jgi:hypothetical protein
MATYQYTYQGAADQYWTQWCQNPQYYTTSSSTAADSCWSNWCSSTATNYTSTAYSLGTSATNDGVFAAWCQQQYYYSPPIVVKQTPPAVTAEMTRRLREQAAQLQEAENQRRELARKIKEEKDAAEARAREMLFDLIGADKREEYERTGQVYVQGHRHGYIIRGYGHVKRIEGDGHIRELCIHLVNQSKYPDTDNVIALLLAIKHDEECFLKTANKHGLRSISDYSASQLKAAGMPKDALRTKIIFPAKAPTLGEGIAA